MAFAQAHHFILSANFHGGAEVINYPWDTWSRRHPDDAWFQYIGLEYVQTAKKYAPPSYFTDVSPTGVINGYEWYRVCGGRQDWMVYFQGCREVTIELSETKLVAESALPLYWEYNREALVGYLEKGLTGLTGKVADRLGHPLRAEISLLNHDTAQDRSAVWTNPKTGRFYRLCLPGAYSIQVIVNPFTPLIQPDVGVGERSLFNFTFANIAIGDLDGNGALNVADVVRLLRITRKQNPPDAATACLADWNNDGTINRRDWQELITYILQHAAK